MAAKAHTRNLKPVVIAISTNDCLSMNAKNMGTLLNSKYYYFVPFGQDDPNNKKNSMIAKMDLIIQTIEMAIEGKQYQPLIIENY